MRYWALLFAAGVCTASGDVAELNLRGVSAYKRGDYAAAEIAYRAAVEAAQTQLQRANVWSNLAAVYKRQKLWDKAAAAYTECAGLRLSALGGGHADYAVTLNNLAEVRREQGLIDEAGALLRRSLGILESMTEPPAADLAAVLNNYGVVRGVGGYYTDGERLLKRALRMKRRLYGAAHPESILTEGNLASLRRDAEMGLSRSRHRVDVMELRGR